MSHTIRLSLVVLATAVAMAILGAAAPSRADAVAPAVAVVVATDADVPPTTVNDLFPQERDVSDCIGTLERPDCGSDQRGDLHLYLTLGALTLGLAVIAWRVTLLVKHRDENLPTPTNTF